MNELEIQIRRKLRGSFEYYSPRCLKITTKSGEFVPFNMNKAQQFVHEKLEQQLKETGKVRAIVLKGRQQGMSTYIQARYLWKTTQKKGVKAFILTHSASATSSLYSMTKRYYNNLPDVVKPVISKNNASELDFKFLDSGYRVATAGSSGVGRGSTIHYLHASEVAYWPNGEEHITGVLQAIADAPGTEIILESTAAGPTGLFYTMCMNAYEGKGDFELIFVPWFWQPEYRTKTPTDFQLTPEEETYKNDHGLDDDQIYWRRKKIETFIRGVADFRREYPATIQEAFTAEAENALWSRTDFKTISWNRYTELLQNADRVDTVIGYDPAGTSNENSDESGIIVSSLIDDTVYVFNDSSGKYKPTEIVTMISNLYYKYDADRLTIETNYGGDWIPSTFESHDPNIVVHKVHARKGKRLRAEPVAQAYRQGRIVHVGDLSFLEDEMTTWNPYDQRMRSPNRIDALVYSVTDLLDIGQPQETPVLWSAG